MQEFIFRDYHSDDEKRDNFKFEANQKIEIFKCDFCDELPTDPRVTRCCKEYVCFECWKENFPQEKIDLTHQHNVWCTCPLCGKNCMTVYEYDDGYGDNISIKGISRFDQQKLGTIKVICPDKNCKMEILFEAFTKHWENDCDRLETCSKCALVTKISDKHTCKILLEEKILAARKELDSIKLKIERHLVEAEYQASEASSEASFRGGIRR